MAYNFITLSDMTDKFCSHFIFISKFEYFLLFTKLILYKFDVKQICGIKFTIISSLKSGHNKPTVISVLVFINYSKF